MSLRPVSFPNPNELRSGWAALAAIMAARGWNDDVYATEDQWYYHDGGGNWVCLRFKEKDKAVLIGHDHEYSDTYYGEAAIYFEEEQTDILKDVPEWWGFDMNPKLFGEWIGFVYGWDGQRWQRAHYDKDDGFESIGLKTACSMDGVAELAEYAGDAPDIAGQPVSEDALNALVSADANISYDLLEAAVPGWDIAAGVAAAHRFLEATM